MVTKQKRGKYLKRELEFKVQWIGYDESEDSWEPYSALRNTEALETYCYANNLQYLLPTQNE